MIFEHRTYFSPRGMPLVFHSILETGDTPVLTVENYCKWYQLFVVDVDGSVTPVDFPDGVVDARAGESAFCDHVPAPVACQRMAVRLGCLWDEDSLDMISGRWAREVEGRFVCQEYSDYEVLPYPL